MIRPMNDAALLAWSRHMGAIGEAPSTLYLYGRYLSRFFAHVAPYAATVDDVEGWIAAHDWSAATRRSAVGALRSFYRWAHDRGRILSDPTAALKRPRMPRPTPKPTPDDVLKAALVASSGDDRWLLRIAVDTGLRRSELARVHSRDVEHHGDGYWLRVVGKGDAVRLVPIPEDVGVWIRQREGWAFPSARVPGEHVGGDCIGKRIKRLLGGYSAHTLRHYFATTTYQSTGDIYATQHLLGHASPVTTQGYVMESPIRLRQAAATAWVA